MPKRSILGFVLGANFICPSGRLHEQHDAMIRDGNVLKPRLPLVRVPRVFLQHSFYLLDTLGILLLKDLVSDDTRKHMAGYVPGRCGKGQYDKSEKYKGCDE